TAVFNDAAWQSGQALLYAGSPDLSTAGVGLYAYWPLDGTSGTIAANLAPGGVAATVVGATWTIDPSRGRVLSFDGNNDYVNAGTFPKVTLDDNFTLTFWANSQLGS